MEQHPEIKGAPILSAAVTSIVVEVFRDELSHGVREYKDGTDEFYKAASDIALKQAMAAVREGTATWTDFMFMQAAECASKTDPAELRVTLTSLGGTIVQWIESLDARFAKGV